MSYSYGQAEHLQHSVFIQTRCTQHNRKHNQETFKSLAKVCSKCSFAYLLHLEFDGGFDLVHLGIHVLIVGEQRGELAGLVQSRAQDTRDLLDQRLRGQEGVVLLGW